MYRDETKNLKELSLYSHTWNILHVFTSANCISVKVDNSYTYNSDILNPIEIVLNRKPEINEYLLWYATINVDTSKLGIKNEIENTVLRFFAIRMVTGIPSMLTIGDYSYGEYILGDNVVSTVGFNFTPLCYGFIRIS